MKITVTMDLTTENLSKLSSLLPGAEIQANEPKHDTPAAEHLKAEPAKEEPKTETPAEAAKKISKTDVKAVALVLSRANKQKELAAIFAQFGAKKLSDIDEDKYGELMPLLSEAAGKLVKDNG